MTEGQEGVQAPEVVEVDSYKEAVDANDSIFDDDGELIQTLNREENKIYRIKGKTNPLEEPKTEDDKSKDANKDKTDATNKDADNPNPDNEEEEEEEEEEDFVNRAAYILKKTGYDKDEVDLGEGIGKKKIADLSHEEQIDVIVGEFDHTIEEKDKEIAELKARKPELKFEDKSAQQIVDYLKNGGDIKKLAKEILSRDPAAQAKMLSDAEIVKMGIKKEYPEFTEEEVDAEFKDIESNPDKLARRAKAIRSRMEKEKPDYGQLTEDQKKERQAAIAAERKVHDDEVAGVKLAAKNLKKIADFELSDQVRDFLVSKVVPANMESDSEFVKSMDGKPEKILELQFWDTYGKKILEKTKDHYYKLGLKEGQQGKEKLSDEPVLRQYQSSSKTKKTEKAVKNLEDVDFDKWLNEESF